MPSRYSAAYRLPLNIGRGILVDDQDRHLLEQYAWFITPNGYAARSARTPGESRTRVKYLHREIKAAPPLVWVDHINHNRLDNRRTNLRFVNNSVNMHNIANPVKGCYFSERTGKWCARVNVNGRRVHLGYYETEQIASAVAGAFKKGYQYDRTSEPMQTNTKLQQETN